MNHRNEASVRRQPDGCYTAGNMEYRHANLRATTIGISMVEVDDQRPDRETLNESQFVSRGMFLTSG